VINLSKKTVYFSFYFNLKIVGFFCRTLIFSFLLTEDLGFTLNSRVIDFRRFGRTYRLHQGSSGPVTPHPLGSASVRDKLHARACVYEHGSGSPLKCRGLNVFEPSVLPHCCITVLVTAVGPQYQAHFSLPIQGNELSDLSVTPALL
jgi:hypothetical protein